MSQIALSNPERIDALQRFGYTEREAQFLVLAALHGGFFLRGQYCRFIGRQIGGTVADLVRKLLTNDHATAVVGCHNTKVYHLGARPFYAALGQEDNRNRRERPTVVIKNKLMCLDFVLDHPGMRYLATEQEKVSYFKNALEIPMVDLPRKLFRSPASDQATERYFVDKYPIFLAEDTTAPSPVVSFCFIDEGLATDSRFESYLDQYTRLFRRLPAFRLMYVAASDCPFRAARNAFESFVGASQEGLPEMQNDTARERLLEHFDARRHYEAQQFETFDRSKLIRFRDDRQAFSGPGYEALYRLWNAGGAPAVDTVLASARKVCAPVQGTFETFLLRYNYSLFGHVSRIPVRGGAQEHPTSAGKTHVEADGGPVVAHQDMK